MQKLLALLIGAILMLSLVACSSGDNTDEQNHGAEVDASSDSTQNEDVATLASEDAEEVEEEAEEEVPLEYIDISIYDHEWKFAPDSNNSDVIDVDYYSGHNGLSIKIPTEPGSADVYHGYYAYEITGPDGFTYSYFPNTSLDNKEHISDAYALRLNESGDEMYFYDMIRDGDSGEFTVDLSSETVYYKLVRTDYHENDNTQVTITATADTLAFTISGNAARAYLDTIADAETNPTTQLRMDIDFHLSTESESGDAQKIIIEYNETEGTHFVMVNHLIFYVYEGVEDTGHRVLKNDEHIVNLTFGEDSFTISYPLYQEEDYTSHDQMYFDETTYGDTVKIHLNDRGSPTLYEKELPFTVVQ